MTNILHKIKAYLYENLLTKDNPNDYIARTVSERSLSVKQICESAVNRGGADISASAMEHATELFLKEWLTSYATAIL
ncbi:DNA-binding domain-containing protein [Epilithonimonas pallida]|uniref:DNA-binding domain-containing protein n=1 Tax=Epilithonimonas pallida TaxID=373671 RepID=A0ABY1R2L7_9FLAO|nr:DNA-binding domain-containing protein [Epilithonimonas pallida]